MREASAWAPDAIIVKHLENTAGTRLWTVTLPNGKVYKVTTYPAPSTLVYVEIPHKVDPRFGARVVHLKKSTTDAIRQAIKDHG